MTKKITLRDAMAAKTFQFIYPVMQRMFYRSPELEFATKNIAPYRQVKIPTRHGEINALVFSPTGEDIAIQQKQNERPPVHVLTHGGAFILQYPQEEGNVARYLASEVGCYVVIPDYTAAPQAQHPVAEHQCYDTFVWVREHAKDYGWDGNRISVGGPSAGGQLALEVALQAIDAGAYVPLAVSSEYGVVDISRSNEQRTSTKARPVVGPGLMTLVRNTYFKGVDFEHPLVSPIFHPRLAELPPTLIMTAEYDTLSTESNELAEKLNELGVNVTHRVFEGVDHGFTHVKPVETAREAIQLLGNHLRTAYRKAQKR